MSSTKKVTRIYNTMDVLAAACLAQEMNSGYVKYSMTGRQWVDENGDVVIKKTNRELVLKYLEDVSQISQTYYELAEKIKQYYRGYTFKMLSGAYMTSFDRTVMKMLEEEFTPEGYNVATLASLPNTYFKSVARDTDDNRIKNTQGGHVGKVGERHNLQCEILRSIFSEKWNTYYITAITSSDQAIFFAYKQNIEVGTVLNIDGTVKCFRDDHTTQLNRVKVK